MINYLGKITRVKENWGTIEEFNVTKRKRRHFGAKKNPETGF